MSREDKIRGNLHPAMDGDADGDPHWSTGLSPPRSKGGATNDIIDDAQGYGFTSAHGAYKALYYKQNYKNIQKEKLKVQKWWDDHKEFRTHWDDILWYATEDNVKVTKDDFIRELKEYNIDIDTLPCEIKYLMKYY